MNQRDFERQKYFDEPDQFKDWKERRRWELGIDVPGTKQTSEDWFYFDKVKGKEDWYDKRLLKHIGRIAKQRGIDPKIAIAIAMSESHGGNFENTNPLHANPQVWEKWVGQYMAPIIEELDAEYKRADEIEKFHGSGLPVQVDVRGKQAIEKAAENEERNAWIHAALNQYDYATKRYGTGTRGLQAYSGTKARPSDQYQRYHGYEGGAFGKPMSKVNFWRDMDQGKRVQAIRSALEGVPAISEETFE